MKRVSRREFLVTGAAACVFSAAIFRSAQGWLEEGRQLFGQGLSRAIERGAVPPQGAELDRVAHALNRLTFGPTPGEYSRVAKLGVERFIEEQLAPEGIEDGLCNRVTARFCDLWGEPLGEHYEEDDEALSPILRRVTTLRAIYSKRQLFEVMCEFWSDHFNIDPGKGDCRWSKPSDDRDVIRKHALGRFRDLLRASALSPAMLWYLDGQANEKRKPEDKPNENYARELMELHTLGVHGGYSQGDVMEVARCLSGWTLRSKKKLALRKEFFNLSKALREPSKWKPLNDRGEVYFSPEAHDQGSKRVLGHEIPAGLGAEDIERVIDIVASHPSTARYIATKLCKRFIADEPPEGVVGAVAKSFTESQGDIPSVLRTIFALPEFFASAGGKVKRPFHYVVSALRVTNAECDGDRPVEQFLEKMGQAPFRYPTPDGYPLEAEHWHSTLLWRWKFALSLSENKIPGTRIERAKLQRQLGGDSALMATVLNRRPSKEEVDSFFKSGDGLALLLASPGFQRC
jgi:uncharacterized protein (DUF1800 family)